MLALLALHVLPALPGRIGGVTKIFAGMSPVVRPFWAAVRDNVRLRRHGRVVLVSGRVERDGDAVAVRCTRTGVVARWKGRVDEGVAGVGHALCVVRGGVATAVEVFVERGDGGFLLGDGSRVGARAFKWLCMEVRRCGE